MLEPSMEIFSKAETSKLGEGHMYWIYLNLAIEGEGITAEGGTQPIRFAINKEDWEKLQVGDRLWFRHSTTVRENGQEVPPLEETV